MEKRTRDINEVLVTASYYTKGFDLNLIKHITKSLCEGRNNFERYSFEFSLDKKTFVVVENILEISTLRTNIKQGNISLVIDQSKDKLGYKRCENGEVFMFSLKEEDGNYVMNTSILDEKGFKLEKKC